MSTTEQTTFGATIEPPAHQVRPMPSTDSGLSKTPVEPGQPSSDPDASNPFSAFYKHPDARRSMDDIGPQSKTHLAVYEKDLESGAPISTTTTQAPKGSIDGRVKECTMWPSRQTMMQKAKARKRERNCNLFRNLNSKQKLWAKILIALFVVACAVGLGVGISRAVGGGVWAGQGHSKEIPDSN